MFLKYRYKKCKPYQRTYILLFLFTCFVYVLWYHSRSNAINKIEKSNKLTAANYDDLTEEEKEYEKDINYDSSIIISRLGDEGEPAYLPPSLEAAGEESIKKYALNVVLSDRISLFRRLKSFSHEDCKKIKYDIDINATIVIIFHNEVLSVLLRTIWSILFNTPKEFLDQIILVDDYSNRDELKGKLDYYLKTRLKNYPVRLERLNKRSGLIRARLHGARLARNSAKALLFLDAHCEVTDRWIEPLLDRIQKNRTTVVMPIIDLINERTLEYTSMGDDFQVGGFTWDGTFDWINIQKPENRKSLADPVRSPTMAGGLFAIERNYFWEIGSYDEQMDGWGGENLEMSFRVWQCGGTLETVPCSRVGHIFRDFHPYRFPDDKDTHGINTARMAKVWMDDYQRFYFLHRPAFNNDAVVGDITHRFMLREKLHCKSFKWYLENIYPEKFIPDENVQAFGRVKNPGTHLCLDDLQHVDQPIYPLGVYSCYENLEATQFFSLSDRGELRKETACAEIVGRPNRKHYRKVLMTKCHGLGGSQLWSITKDSQLLNPGSSLCLNVKELVDSQNLYASPCFENIPEQVFKFDNYTSTLKIYKSHIKKY